MTVLIISGLLVSSIFIGSIVKAATNSGTGTGELSPCSANVEVDSLRYDPVTQRTYSCHWYEIINYLNRKLAYTYEFTHQVYEVVKRNDRKEVVRQRDVGLSQTFLGATVKSMDNFDLCGAQGISMSGQRAGEYEIKAYTAVAANIQGGRLFVKTPDEVSGFTILD
ncbi:MAG: hypothetical protein OXM61_20020 [Candidatus Poribacteria bacterium]|nr:hypothetical protein [Candidatus Poribacteria bacterium]